MGKGRTTVYIPDAMEAKSPIATLCLAIEKLRERWMEHAARGGELDDVDVAEMLGLAGSVVTVWSHCEDLVAEVLHEELRRRKGGD